MFISVCSNAQTMFGVEAIYGTGIGSVGGGGVNTAIGCFEYSAGIMPSSNKTNVSTVFGGVGYYWDVGISAGALFGTYVDNITHVYSNTAGLYLRQYIGISPGAHANITCTLSYIYLIGVNLGIGVAVGERTLDISTEEIDKKYIIENR